MAKIHINNDGEPGNCSASSGNCPFGGPEDHYTSKEAARKAYELRMGGEEELSTEEKITSLNEAARDTNFSKPAYGDLKKVAAAVARLNKRGEAKTPEQLRDLRWEQDIVTSKSAIEESKIHEERLSRLLAKKDNRPMAELLASGEISPSSEKIRLTDGMVNTVDALPHLNGDSKRALYALPASFMGAIQSTHEHRPHATSGIEALISMATKVRETDPNFEPGHFRPSSRANGYLRPDNIPQMQNVTPKGYSLMERYTREKYGDESKSFWRTVRSDSVNYPKISDFIRAEKEFDKR